MNKVLFKYSFILRNRHPLSEFQTLDAYVGRQNEVFRVLKYPEVVQSENTMMSVTIHVKIVTTTHQVCTAWHYPSLRGRQVQSIAKKNWAAVESKFWRWFLNADDMVVSIEPFRAEGSEFYDENFATIDCGVVNIGWLWCSKCWYRHSCTGSNSKDTFLRLSLI